MCNISIFLFYFVFGIKLYYKVLQLGWAGLAWPGLAELDWLAGVVSLRSQQSVSFSRMISQGSYGFRTYRVNSVSEIPREAGTSFLPIGIVDLESCATGPF